VYAVLLLTISTNCEIPGSGEVNRVVYASTGGNYSFLVTDTGQIYSCGDNENGQLGQGMFWFELFISLLGVDQEMVTRFAPISDKSPKELLAGFPFQIACGARHVLILTRHGLVFGAGSNAHDELGISDRVWLRLLPRC
jgi:alpha-tubulin suppressor-like RCC1 family protein